mmetsp:Transcript_13387/g.32799  ORF Transcript_13387/g.32799 Transcript_13387/m.32799 type:complete len:231 (+) Transcript_13387:1345-2037(+)
MRRRATQDALLFHNLRGEMPRLHLVILGRGGGVHTCSSDLKIRVMEVHRVPGRDPEPVQLLSEPDQLQRVVGGNSFDHALHAHRGLLQPRQNQVAGFHLVTPPEGSFSVGEQHFCIGAPAGSVRIVVCTHGDRGSSAAPSSSFPARLWRLHLVHENVGNLVHQLVEDRVFAVVLHADVLEIVPLLQHVREAQRPQVVGPPFVEPVLAGDRLEHLSAEVFRESGRGVVRHQ